MFYEITKAEAISNLGFVFNPYQGCYTCDCNVVISIVEGQAMVSWGHNFLVCRLDDEAEIVLAVMSILE